MRVVLLGQGMVANHFAVGLERIKQGELQPYGVPLADFPLPYRIEDIEVVASYDVDEDKVGKSLYRIAREALEGVPIPKTLRDIYVRRGVHLGSLRGLPFKASGLEERMSLAEAVDRLVDEWRELGADVIVNVITTERGVEFGDLGRLLSVIESDERDAVSASQLYAYAAARYSAEVRPVAFINVIPSPLANDPAYVELFQESRGVVLGDDGATGATPLTADLLEHLAERGRKVRFVVQFNIGGNTDFLALTIPEKNVMKERTKSSIVEDILGYDAPHYIKPTGYVETLGDKKYVALHIEYVTFNGLVDELYVNMRLNDSPALAGKLVDLVRLGRLAVDAGLYGTIYEINAFYMKKPGPKGSKSISKIVAYHRMVEWLKKKVLGRLPARLPSS